MPRKKPSKLKGGYAVIKNFFDPAILPQPDYAPGLDTTEIGSMIKRSTTGVHLHEPYRSISQDARLLKEVAKVIGNGIYIHQSRVNYKLPFVGTGWHWHSDFETWHYQDGMPEMDCITVMIPLTSNTQHNGPLLVIPDTQDYFYCAPKPEKSFSAQENFADQKEGLPDAEAVREIMEYTGSNIEAIICNPGDIVLFDCNILHGSVPNMSPQKRTNLFFVYNSASNMLVDPYSGDEPRPEEMGARKNIEILC